MIDQDNSTLIVVNMPEGTSDSARSTSECLKFIEKCTGGQAVDDAAIMDTFPILFVCGSDDIPESLKPYAVEELTFSGESVLEACNNGGQTLGEILSLLDVTDVYLCGITGSFRIKDMADTLSKNSFTPHIL